MQRSKNVYKMQQGNDKNQNRRIRKRSAARLCLFLEVRNPGKNQARQGNPLKRIQKFPCRFLIVITAIALLLTKIAEKADAEERHSGKKQKPQ